MATTGAAKAGIQPAPEATGPKPQLKLWQRLFYAGAVVGGDLTNMSIVTWAMYYYAPPAGHGTPLMPISWFAATMVFGRIVDAVADPLVGFWSDRSRSRWGRRIPFLTLSGLPLALVFILLWFPPAAGASAVNGFFFAGALGVFFFLFTVYFCPHGALLPEITQHSGERVNISVIIAIFGLLSTAFVGVGSGVLVDNFGFKLTGIVIGMAAIPFLYGPVVALREKPRSEADEITVSFKEAALMTFRNKPFVTYVMSTVFGQLGQNALIAGLPYFVTVVLGGTESQVGYLMGAHLLVAMLSFPVVTKLAEKVGKARVYRASLLLGGVILGLMFLVGRFDLPLSPLWQTVVLTGLAGVAFSASYALPVAILADAIDFEFERTGKRRSAMYYGIQGVLQKSSIALSAVLLSVLFTLFGYSAAHPLGVYLIGPVTGLLFVGGWFVFRGYPLMNK